MNDNGQQRFDGFAVSVYDGKFSGGFDLEDDLGSKVAFDDVVTFLVSGRVSSVGITETKLGDLKRTNTFQVTSSVALEPKQAETLLTSLGEAVDGVNAGQLSLGGDDASPLDPDAAIPLDDPVLAKFLDV